MKNIVLSALTCSLFLSVSNIVFGQCFIPLINESETISETEHEISWGQNAFAISFSVQYRQLNADAEWNNVYGITGNNLLLTDLIPCTNYEYQVRMLCENDSSEFSNIDIIQTLGCGACHDGNYCVTSVMNTNGGQNIARVRVKTIDNITGSAQDGWNYTHFSTTIAMGEPYKISVQAVLPWNDYMAIFIDWNQDGDFVDPSEYVHNFGLSSNNLTSTPWYQVPSNAIIGCTRMRLIRQITSITSPCPSISASVEDYCFCISEGIPTSVTENEPTKINLYPNPATNILTIDLGSLVLNDKSKNTFLLYNTIGQIVLNNSFENSPASISLGHLPNGYYQALILEAGNILLRKPVIISK